VKALTAQGIVEAWGRGKKAPEYQRPLALLSVALPDTDPAEMIDLSLGRRDALLLELRSKTFGAALTSHAHCTQCKATLHFELDAGEILAESSQASNELTGTVERDGFEVRFRPLTTRDLAATARCSSVDEGRETLLDRCVVEATRAGTALAPHDLPEDLVMAISERIESMDPLIEVPVNLSCSSCEGETSVVLDIGVFFWEEVAAAAERLLYDVFLLARSYGWKERDILAMGAARREYYLEMANR
jgi:hypothetical protein